MNCFILSKNNLNDFLAALDSYELFVPIRKNGITVLAHIDDPLAIKLDLTSQPYLVKQTIFPQTESLFTFDRKKGIKAPSFETNHKSQVVFGIRSCDARGFCIIDPVFEEDYPDPYYIHKRKSTILIGLQCIEPFTNCFCTSVGGSPSSTEGLDLQFTDIGESYFVEVITQKGEEIIKVTAPFLSCPDKNQSVKKDEVKKDAEQKVKRKIDVNQLSQKIEQIFEDSVWSDLAEKCISCGICTFFCPTCYCFDIQDEIIRGKGKRLRTWDSCMYSEYTAHASGYNPRPTRMERLRNRIYHKFKQNIDRYGVSGCVGCGRCITLCPSNEDIVENIETLQRL